MDGISFLQPLAPELQEFFYERGNAHGWLSKTCKTAASNYHLAGRLYLAKSGWLLLSVPNAFVRGLFDALVAPGAELPTTDLMNVPNVDAGVLNAHISVMTADEVAKIGADKINERGQTFNYGLGPVEEIPVHNVDGVSKVWAVQIKSPALSALRKSYGLAPYIHNDHQFHITVAARRKKVLANNDVSKFDSATGRGELKAASDDKTTYDCCCSGPCMCPDTCVCKKHGKCGHAEKEAADTQERVRVVLPYKGKYLLETLNNPKWPANLGKRRFIGGGIEPGETPEQAATREMFEELGVKIKPTAFRHIGHDPNKPHEHYLQLLRHKLKPGNYNATVGSDAVISLSEGLPTGADYIGPNIKKLLAPVLKKAAELPWRERAEVYARDPATGKIYGGKWDNDGTFALPGGGIDPGEDPTVAALRELKEETGITANNARLLPIPPVDLPWSDKVRAEKAKQGRGGFAGSRTHFVVADIVNHPKTKNLDYWAATNRGYYSPADALAIMKNVKKFNAPAVAAGRIAALKHIIEQAASKTAAADLLPGGAADNKPDSDFPADKLEEGAEHEREHTDNDEIAKEIAKDHLQEDPAYYEEKQEDVKHAKEMPSILRRLQEAKAHSDAKRYDKKNAILRELMLNAPNEWYVDDPIPHHMGVTHDPTKFRFHAHPTIIPPGVKVKAKAAAAEPYLAQLQTTPISYNKDDSVWRNFVNHLVKVKGRGDHQLHTQQNSAGLLRAMNPQLRQQYYMDVARGKNPGEPGLMTKIINRHGDSVLSALA